MCGLHFSAGSWENKPTLKCRAHIHTVSDQSCPIRREIAEIPDSITAIFVLQKIEPRVLAMVQGDWYIEGRNQ
jgi:hypothetical protein